MTTYEWSDKLDSLEKQLQFVNHQIDTAQTLAMRCEFESKKKRNRKRNQKTTTMIRNIDYDRKDVLEILRQRGGNAENYPGGIMGFNDLITDIVRWKDEQINKSHAELVTRLYNLVNATNNMLADIGDPDLELRRDEAQETLNKLIQ